VKLFGDWWSGNHVVCRENTRWRFHNEVAIRLAAGSSPSYALVGREEFVPVAGEDAEKAFSSAGPHTLDNFVPAIFRGPADEFRQQKSGPISVLAGVSHASKR